MQSPNFTGLHDTRVDRSERNGRFAIVGLMHLNIVLASDLINNGNATTRGLHGGKIAAKFVAPLRVIHNPVKVKSQERCCLGGRDEGHGTSLLDQKHPRSLMAM